jgi:hypothetical protein
MNKIKNTINKQVNKIGWPDFVGSFVILSFLFILDAQESQRFQIIILMSAVVGIMSAVFNKYIINFNPMVSLFQHNTRRRLSQEQFNKNIRGQFLAMVVMFVLLLIKTIYDGESYINYPVPYQYSSLLEINILYLVQIFVFETLGVFLLINLYRTLDPGKNEAIWNGIKLGLGYFAIYFALNIIGYGVSLNPFNIIVSSIGSFEKIPYLIIYLLAHFFGLVLRLIVWENYENN